MMVKWLSRLDLPSPMIRVQKDKHPVERITSLQLSSDFHNKPNSKIQNNDFYQKLCSGGLTAASNC